MRSIQDALSGHTTWAAGMSISAIASEVYQTDAPTASQRRNVLRAVRALEAADEVTIEKVDVGTRTGMPTPGLIVWEWGAAGRAAADAKLATIEADIARALGKSADTSTPHRNS